MIFSPRSYVESDSFSRKYINLNMKYLKRSFYELGFDYAAFENNYCDVDAKHFKLSKMSQINYLKKYIDHKYNFLIFMHDEHNKICVALSIITSNIMHVYKLYNILYTPIYRYYYILEDRDSQAIFFPMCRESIYFNDHCFQSRDLWIISCATTEFGLINDERNVVSIELIININFLSLNNNKHTHTYI